MQPIIFWILTAWVISSAGLVVMSKNNLSAVLWLIVTFIGVSGHFILLDAQYLAIINLIVYAGAIMVLFLFVIMLLDEKMIKQQERKAWTKFAAIVSGALLALVLVMASGAQPNAPFQEASTAGLIENIGRTLFTDYVVPFEISSILFLAAMVGAMIIGKKE